MRPSVLFVDDPISVRKTADGYILQMRLPFVTGGDLDVHRRGEELVVRVGPYKRNLLLPQTLKRMVVRGANLVEDHLEIVFARAPGAEGESRRCPKALSPRPKSLRRRTRRMQAPARWRGAPSASRVGAVQPVAPDVVEHLLKAGTEMFLAFRAIVEQRGDDLEGRTPAEPVRLEKIDIG